MERFWFKTCQIRHFPRPKRTLLENGNAQSVAIFSRTNGNANKWKFELQFLNIGTKMEFHLFASILYSDIAADSSGCDEARKGEQPQADHHRG